MPLAQLAGLNLNLVMREDGRTGTAGRGRRPACGACWSPSRSALAFVLLIGAGLLFASFRQLLAVDPGFTAEHVLTGSVGLSGERYANDAQRTRFVERALTEIRALPGVASAGATQLTCPSATARSSSVIIAEGYAMAPGESVISPNNLRVTPGYFETLRRAAQARAVLHRIATPTGAPRVIIIDERLARKFFANADPIGRRMYLARQARRHRASRAQARNGCRWSAWSGAVKLRELVEGEQSRARAPTTCPTPRLRRADVGFVDQDHRRSACGSPPPCVRCSRGSIPSCCSAT